jgi:hypothetical protein
MTGSSGTVVRAAENGVRAAHTGAAPSAASVWRQGLQRRNLIPWLRRYTHPFSSADFVLEEFGEFLQGSVLDVGAGSNQFIFKRHLGDLYRAVDIGDSYKLDGAQRGAGFHAPVDLERCPLPFPDCSFDTVMCTGALEHLDNIYGTYDELFRVAHRYVIIWLPNNWPGMMGSLLAGHNISHRAGYGLPPFPKKDGQRHKYFFNFEEACEFLTGRMPAAFSVRRVEFRFEYMTDGLMFSLPVVGRFFRLTHGALGKAEERYGKWGGRVLWLGARTVTLPARIVDALIGALIWGWGDPVRFYNMFCRQVWFVFERTPASDTPQPAQGR